MINSKTIKSIIPFIGTTIIICGFIKFQIIFGYFGVKIHNYLDFSEILTLFLPDVIRSILVISFAIFIGYLVVSSNRLDKNVNEIRDIMESDKFFKRLKLIFKKYNFLAIYSLVILVGTLILYFRFPEKLRDYIIANAFIPSLFVFIILNYEFKRKYKLIHTNEITSSQSMLTFVVFAFVSQTILSGFSEIRKIERNKSEISFIYDGKTIKSDKSKLYIGQTRNYIFLKDAYNNKNYIFNKGNISHLITRKN